MKKSLLVVGLIGILSLTACSSSTKEIEFDDAKALVNAYTVPADDKAGTVSYDASKDVLDDHKSGMPEDLKQQVELDFNGLRGVFGVQPEASPYLAKEQQLSELTLIMINSTFGDEMVDGSIKYTTSDDKDLTIDASFTYIYEDIPFTGEYVTKNDKGEVTHSYPYSEFDVSFGAVFKATYDSNGLPTSMLCDLAFVFVRQGVEKDESTVELVASRTTSFTVAW